MSEREAFSNWDMETRSFYSMTLVLYSVHSLIQDETTSFAQHAFGRYASAHGLDPLFDECESQPCAGTYTITCVICLVEALPDAWQILRCDAFPGILDMQNERFWLCRNCDCDDAARRGVPHSVVEQI